MALNRTSGVPAYRQIAGHLRDRILSGELAPGAKLPTEVVLADRYQVDRSTVRRALALLHAEGRIASREGSGTTVRQQTPPAVVELLLEIDADSRGVFMHRHAQDWDLLEPTRIAREPAPLDVGQLLGVGRGTQVLVRDRIIGPQGGPPGQLATTYILPGVASGLPRLARPDTGPTGYLGLLEAQRGPLRYTVTVASRMPTPAEASALQLAQGQPVLVLTRISYDPADTDQPLEATVYRLPADRFVLTFPLIDRRRPGRGLPDPGPHPEPPGANGLGVVEPAHEDDLSDDG